MSYGKVISDDYTLIHAGHKKKHKQGVGQLLNNVVAKSVMGHHAISDRILLVKILGNPFNLSIIQVYATTSTCTDDNIEKLYSDLDDAYKECGRQDVVSVMGDMNANVGAEQDPQKKLLDSMDLGNAMNVVTYG